FSLESVNRTCVVLGKARKAGLSSPFRRKPTSVRFTAEAAGSVPACAGMTALDDFSGTPSSVRDHRHMMRHMKRSPWLAGVLALAMLQPGTALARVEVPGKVVAKKPVGAIALTVRLPDPAQKVLYVEETIPV